MFQAYFPFMFEKCTDVNAMNAAPDSIHYDSNQTPGAIAGIDNPVILRYFETLNQGEFERMSEKFKPTLGA